MKRWRAAIGLCLILALGGSGLNAQVRQIDPNAAIDSDISRTGAQSTPAGSTSDLPPPATTPAYPASSDGQGQVTQSAPPPAPTTPSGTPDATRTADSTYSRQDLLSAGEGVFGKGAQGLAGLLEKILREQGEPNAYIAGREASGAFIVGARYGSGIMSHKVEGDMPVYWTGPSVGFDAGGNASKVFVLVYNLFDSEEIFRRYPEGEGHLYFVGGFSATYLRRGNIVLIPIRLGVGLRAGVNVGYMKFSKKAKWLPL